MADMPSCETDEPEPFGQWLVEISRPGVDLHGTLELLRSAPVRSIDLDLLAPRKRPFIRA
jgi:hypothetical protein